MNVLTNAIRAYWDLRAKGFSRSNQEELASNFPFEACIRAALPASSLNGTLKALDIGCGPGIMGILLARMGFEVSGLDMSLEMLKEARQNAQSEGLKLDWILADAVNPPFAPESFDVLITRNLTWNLPDIELAYRNWCSLLVPGGVLINFDGNHYYRYTDKDYDNAERVRNHRHLEGVNVTVIDNIACDLVASQHLRPAYDVGLLQKDARWASVTTQFLHSETKKDKTLIWDFLLTATKA